MNSENKEVPESTLAEIARRNDLLSSIAELGGRGMKEEDVVFEGKKLVLPERFRGSVQSAVNFLKKKIKDDEEVSAFGRTYDYRPWDGALNAYLALKETFGPVLGVTTYSFFGKNSPHYIQVPISATETAEVPWGDFEIPLLENTTFSFGTAMSSDYGLVFRITVESPRKNKHIIEGLFQIVAERLKTHSIYRGKAFDGQADPQFLELEGFDSSKVVYSEQVLADLNAHLWSVLKYSKDYKAVGLSLKKSLLLTGPYGTGKSLAALRTAVEAGNSGWTFIMARPGRDNFLEVMQTARLYQPAVVFMEDVDTIATAENEEVISQLLDLFDGIQSKNTELAVVMTTNHPETLHKGMMRPGRLDAIIEIGALDDTGVEKLLLTSLPAEIVGTIDFVEVCKACAGYMPAFVKEVADRALRYCLARNNGSIKGQKIETEDLVFAANGLRPQFNRMQDAPERSNAESLGTAMEKTIETTVTRSISELAADPENASKQVWNTTTLAKAKGA